MTKPSTDVAGTNLTLNLCGRRDKNSLSPVETQRTAIFPLTFSVTSLISFKKTTKD